MSENKDHSALKDIRKMGREELRAYYDQWAESYDKTLQSWDYQAPKQAASMLRPLIPGEATMFDAGCGTGLSGQALRDAGYSGRIDGSDLSPESVELARKREIYDTVEVIDLDRHPLPVASDLYDATLSIGVLTYIQDLTGLLSEFCRVTRPGGYVLFTHRDDLVAEQDFFTLTEDLVEKGLWEKVEVTDPQPYLPGHPDYADDIGIIYFLFRVR
ncbi:class I SAM-dependent DNA methyltransferase [Arhodomonas sp. SL1]|uniref:class I SAM-dependent DNA methyltransferase n=1 Tax=Arhodomonas sp. SL1 TaxID=3425691 RepID=UPI003F88480A